MQTYLDFARCSKSDRFSFVFIIQLDVFPKMGVHAQDLPQGLSKWLKQLTILAETYIWTPKCLSHLHRQETCTHLKPPT